LSRCGDAAYVLKQHLPGLSQAPHQPAWQESSHDRKVIDGIIAPSLVRRTFIAPIIIDGYNLIGIQHRDLRNKREELIQQLIAYKKLKGHDIIVVFDGWKTGGHREEHAVTGGIRVIYSRLGDRADDVIRKIISQEKKEWIVITSDREIARQAWASGSVPVSSDDFRQRLGKDDMNRGEVSESPYDEEGDVRKKGNPRQPSKKEKALIRILRKL